MSELSVGCCSPPPLLLSSVSETPLVATTIGSAVSFLPIGALVVLEEDDVEEEGRDDEGEEE